MDTMDQASSPDSFMPDFNMTDYNPEDIDQINVNELLLQYNKNYTWGTLPHDGCNDSQNWPVGVCRSCFMT